MAREIRILGGFAVEEPTTVMGLKSIRKALVEQGTEAALKKIDEEIRHRWVIDGYWANVTLEPVHEHS